VCRCCGAAASLSALRTETGVPYIDRRSPSAASRSLPASVSGPSSSRSGRSPRGGLTTPAAVLPEPQHCLNLRPLPQGQGSLRLVRSAGAPAGSFMTRPPRAIVCNKPHLS
jgi:hypothetical protein